MCFRGCRLSGVDCPAYWFGLESKQNESLTYTLLAVLRAETQQVMIYLGLLGVFPNCSAPSRP